MARKNFDIRLFVSGETIEIRRDAEARIFLRLTAARAPGCSCVEIWTGAGNSGKPAGEAPEARRSTSGLDDREPPCSCVQAQLPARLRTGEHAPRCAARMSGRAFSHGWQPLAFVDRDRLTVEHVSRTVEHEAYVSHVLAGFEHEGFSIVGPLAPMWDTGLRVLRADVAHNGAPKSRCGVRNREDNAARDAARANFAALMEHGRRQQGS